MSKRANHDAVLRARVALEAVKGERTLSGLATTSEVIGCPGRCLMVNASIHLAANGLRRNRREGVRGTMPNGLVGRSHPRLSVGT